MTIYPYIFGALAFLVVLMAEGRRRRIVLKNFRLWPVLPALDVATPAATMGVACGLLATLFPTAVHQGILPLHSTATVGVVCCLAIFTLAWFEGGKEIQFQRPVGLVFAEAVLLAGISLLIEVAVFRSTLAAQHSAGVLLGSVCVVSGGALIASIVPPFMKRYEGLRILDRVATQAQHAQPEYTPATEECPQPQLWSMLDSQTTELEVLDLLKTLVTTVKPKLIVETGTFLGYGTVKLAEGARENGFGRVITIEFDPDIHARAMEHIKNAGLSEWVEGRLESSLDCHIEGTIDLLYSDSHLKNREQEIRRLLPQLNPLGLLVIHDASSHFKIVREAAFRLEQEGLISMVLLPTPRGVVIAQKREGRR